MKVEQKRIFICDLPETATESDIQNVFSNYGKVVSVEIKERKELGSKHSSLFFAYINLETDDKTLQKCFKDFSDEKWHGKYVYVQLARESFLDRLRKEREENAANNKNQVSKVTVEAESELISTPKVNKNGIKQGSTKNQETLSEDSSSSSDEEPFPRSAKSTARTQIDSLLKKHDKGEVSLESSVQEHDPDIIIKNNKNKKHNLSRLQIESVGKEPILKIQISKKKTDSNTSEANLKRLESLKNLKKGYHTQKSLIQAALSNIDGKRKNKIIFDDDVEPQSKKTKQNDAVSKHSLFNDESDDEHFEGNFRLKEQFQGKEGQKLLELQSKYKNDKRFQLDSRFRNDDNEVDIIQSDNVDRDEDDMTVEDEVRKEYDILNEILGKNLTPRLERKSESTMQKKSMLRFDPSQPEHSKFEIQKDVQKVKKKKKKDVELVEEKKQEDKDAPLVSKDVFYKVHDNLKESLQEKNEFSLLNLFGKADDTGNDGNEESVVNPGTNNRFMQEKEPFRYESSDDEDETGHIPNSDNMENNTKSIQETHEVSSSKRNFWVEPFFFKNDDYRLQEGFDFLERMRSGEEGEFKKLRRDIKQIVRAKVRNNQQRNKPFKKKLGGNKKKKMLRMKRALKR